MKTGFPTMRVALETAMQKGQITLAPNKTKPFSGFGFGTKPLSFGDGDSYLFKKFKNDKFIPNTVPRREDQPWPNDSIALRSSFRDYMPLQEPVSFTRITRPDGEPYLPLEHYPDISKLLARHSVNFLKDIALPNAKERFASDYATLDEDALRMSIALSYFGNSEYFLAAVLHAIENDLPGLAKFLSSMVQHKEILNPLFQRKSLILISQRLDHLAATRQLPEGFTSAQDVWYYLGVLAKIAG